MVEMHLQSVKSQFMKPDVFIHRKVWNSIIRVLSLAMICDLKTGK